MPIPADAAVSLSVRPIIPAERLDFVVAQLSVSVLHPSNCSPPANGLHLPPVHSRHNGFWYWRPPPDAVTEAVVTGRRPRAPGGNVSGFA
jgi:hypothetical protein